jgi:hypothetical protein
MLPHFKYLHMFLGHPVLLRKLTTQLHLVPRSRKLGALPPLPQHAFMAWCSVKKKHRGNFYVGEKRNT